MLLGQLVSECRKESARAHARVWGGQEIVRKLELTYLGIVRHDSKLIKRDERSE